jgi:Fe-S-cluster containining protein
MYEENLAFRSYLKVRANPKKLDKRFLELHNELFAKFDCCKCANCCKAFGIVIDENDIKNAARFLGQSEESFMAEYVVESDPFEEMPYQFKDIPCVFLEKDGRCSIEYAKPQGCRDFPFTDKPDRISKLLGVIEAAEICPVVHEILQRLKVIYKFYTY